MIFITGVAGFIGCNVAEHFLARGEAVVGLDSLVRPGSETNRAWLEGLDGDFRFEQADVRDAAAVVQALPTDCRAVFHLAGQVAVTTSVQDPRSDFEHNALGTLNVLEAVRHKVPQAAVVYASTNKVYGGLEHVGVEEQDLRYGYADGRDGIAETEPLDFHSPYGCSKGCGDQYVRDYARIYGLKTVVFRQSCIYGTRQFGVEDQGWAAHLFLCAARGQPITIFGDGKQVRDLLWIGDLVKAYEQALEGIEAVKGEVFNLGGGTENTVSVWRELGPRLEKLAGGLPAVRMEDWRPGDQRIYVSDVGKAGRLLGWRPEVGLDEGLQRLWQWIKLIA